MVNVDPERSSRGRLAAAGQRRQPFDLARQLDDREPVGVANHGHDQPRVGRGRQADVAVAPLHDLARRVVQGGVELRELRQRLRRRLDDERQERQLDAARRQPLVRALAQRHQVGAVDLLDVGVVRRGLLRPHEVLGDLLAHAAERQAHVVAVGRDRRLRRRWPAAAGASACARTSSAVTRPAGPEPDDVADVDADLARELARRGHRQHARVARADAVVAPGTVRRGAYAAGGAAVAARSRQPAPPCRLHPARSRSGPCRRDTSAPRRTCASRRARRAATRSRPSPCRS